MMAPDSALIAEVVLYCSGFQEAPVLSKKVRMHYIHDLLGRTKSSDALGKNVPVKRLYNLC